MIRKYLACFLFDAAAPLKFESSDSILFVNIIFFRIFIFFFFFLIQLIFNIILLDNLFIQNLF